MTVPEFTNKDLETSLTANTGGHAVEDGHALAPQGHFRGYAEQRGRVFQMGTGVQINAEHLNVTDFLERSSLQGLSSYSPRPISSIDPLDLGVHRSEANQAGSPPEYITRNIDVNFRKRISEMQVTGGFILLVGDSTAGKSRSAFEALRATNPTGSLWAPVDGRDLILNLKNIVVAQDGCFIWLDDLERYIGPEGLDPTALAIIRQFKICVVATMRAEQYRRLSPEDGDAQDRDHNRGHAALGSRVLEQLETFVLPRMWSESEVERARGVADSRITNALPHSDLFGVAEYLAAGPRLYQEWVLAGGPGGNPRGAALVAAAVDLARCGITGPIPLSTLLILHEIYLERAGGDLLRPESQAQALDWATKRRYGVTSLLLPMKAGSHYRIFDYLPDALARSGHALTIPEATWEAALQHAGLAGFSFHVGMAAIQYHEWEVAQRAWQDDLEKNPIPARINLGRVYLKLNQKEKARTLWQEATDLGSIDAAIYLGGEYEKEGRIGRAISLYQIGANKGDPHAIRHLAYALPDDKEAIAWWLQIAESDSTGNDAFNLGSCYHNLGDTESSKKWWKVAAERGSRIAMNNYGLALKSDGNIEEGQYWLKKAADNGDPKGMINWADRLYSQGMKKEAVHLLEDAAQLGEPSAYNMLAIIEADAGNSVRASEFWRAGHEAGDPKSSYNLAQRLQGSGETEEAQELYRVASAAGEPRAALRYAFILAESGDVEEAEVQFRYALDVAQPPEVCDFGHTLHDRGFYRLAMNWLDLALMKNHTHAGCLAGQTLFYSGYIEDGERLLRISLSGGHKHAGDVLAEFLVRTGRGVAAARVMRAAASANDQPPRRPGRDAIRKRRKRRKR